MYIDVVLVTALLSSYSLQLPEENVDSAFYLLTNLMCLYDRLYSESSSKEGQPYLLKLILKIFVIWKKKAILCKVFSDVPNLI